MQTGFGRTGGKMWGIEHDGVEPDVMTMAKGIANGYPISAVLATTAIADSWKGGNISTFGGNPISSTAANATIDVRSSTASSRTTRRPWASSCVRASTP